MHSQTFTLNLNELKQKSWQNSIKIALFHLVPHGNWRKNSHFKLIWHWVIALIWEKIWTTIYCAVYCGYLAFLQVIPSAETFVSHKKWNHNFKNSTKLLALSCLIVFKVVFFFVFFYVFLIQNLTFRQGNSLYSDGKLRLNFFLAFIMDYSLVIQCIEVFLHLELLRVQQIL